jgi:tetratricopeptide (TPR) repeat protein
MMSHKRNISRMRFLILDFHSPSLFHLINLLIIAMCLFTSSCIAKNVRVEVSTEDKTRADAVAQEGNVAFNKKDYYPALIKYLEAIRLNPDNEIVLNRLGIAYSQLNYYKEAADAFQRSIQLNPKYAYSVNNLGSAFFAAKELKKAEKYFKKALKLNSQEASFHMNLGALYFEKKKPEKALSEWRKALALNPDVFTNNSSITLSIAGQKSSYKERDYYFARIYGVTGDTAKAIAYLEKAILNGFSDLLAIQKQKDFDPIRKEEAFIEFLKKAVFLINEKKEEKSNLPSAIPILNNQFISK